MKTGSDTTLVSHVHYNGRGQLRVLERASGVDTTYNYYAAAGAAGTGNSNFRLSNITAVKSGAAALLNVGYQYDPVGNITQITDNTLASYKTQTFVYDHLNRLTEAATPLDAVDDYDDTYSYDTLGNITAFDGAVYDYTTWHAGCGSHGSQPLPHAVKMIDGSGGDYFCYDDNGNMHKRRQDGVTYNQAFDVENRLVSVTRSGGGTTTFAYDANGQRVMTSRPDGSVVYAPFADYEEEVRPLQPPPTPTPSPTPTPTSTPTPGPPAAPTNLTATYHAFPRRYVMLSWSPFQAPAGTTFNVYRSAQLPVPLNAAHRIASGLTSGGYSDSAGQLGDYYVVTAQNSLGESAPSNTALATTGGAGMMGGGEEEVIRRTVYHIAGQAVAVRVVVVGGNTNLLHLHNDHLGSNSVMSYNSGGGAVGGSRVRYYPYGDWRTAPTQTFTDIAYTGQRENMELGLYYYNARYYVPGIGRFASADTIVPQPDSPQSFNRYAYGLNNPVKYTDPTGHAYCMGLSCDIMWNNQTNSTSVRNINNSPLNFLIATIAAGHDSAKNKSEQIFSETGTIAPFAQFGGIGSMRGDSGFQSQFRDDHLYGEVWGIEQPASRQVGHFLSAVRMGYDEGKINRWVKKYLIVRHEQASDGRGVLGQLLGFLNQAVDPVASSYGGAIRNGHIGLFDRAVALDASGNFGARDEVLQDILRPFPAQRGGFGPLDYRIGNSMEDLRLSVRGWRLGSLVASGEIQTNQDLANWMALYVAGD